MKKRTTSNFLNSAWHHAHQSFPSSALILGPRERSSGHTSGQKLSTDGQAGEMKSSYGSRSSEDHSKDSVVVLFLHLPLHASQHLTSPWVTHHYHYLLFNRFDSTHLLKESRNGCAPGNGRFANMFTEENVSFCIRET